VLGHLRDDSPYRGVSLGRHDVFSDYLVDPDGLEQRLLGAAALGLPLGLHSGRLPELALPAGCCLCGLRRRQLLLSHPLGRLLGLLNRLRLLLGLLWRGGLLCALLHRLGLGRGLSLQL